MFLTICIPTYNRAYILPRALNSLEKQTDFDFEVLIIDDGSTDDTGEIVAPYLNIHHSWKYLKKKNGGKHTALNTGIANAQGEYFLILDSDNFLENDCVENLKRLICGERYKEKEHKLCGVIGKCRNLKNSKIIGESFKKETISYIDLHFLNKGLFYGDCCECIKVSILKGYHWPEDEKTKFVPESYVFDKIGEKYELLTTNIVLSNVEYLEDGITMNINEFQRKNIVGFLYGYVSTLDNIFPNIKIPLKKQVSIWRLYWNAVCIDGENVGRGPRVVKVNLIGKVTKIMLPILNKIK